jgi:hypothetical protein
MSLGSVMSKGKVLVVLLLAGVAGLVLFLWLRWPAANQPVPVTTRESEAARTGREIRYNATLALAVKGSDKVPFDVLCEMLDEDRQLQNCWVELKNGQRVSDEAVARKFILNTLKAAVDWQKHYSGKSQNKLKEFEKVYAAVEELAKKSLNKAVQKEAELTLAALKKGPKG